MKKILKDKKAITLIALVITIVVLVILAVVTISLTVGNDGLIARALKAAKGYKDAQERDKTSINDLYGQLMVATDDNAEITLKVSELKQLIKQNSANYSSTEHIIGTWINGKPLYEKTITASIDEKTSLTKNNYVQNIYSVGTTEEIQQFKGHYVSKINGNVEDLPYIIYSNDNSTSPGTLRKSIRIVYNNTDRVLQIIEQGNPGQFVSFDARVTIQYTKTTD